MTTKTETVHAIHGDVEYDVNECMACGQSYLPEDTTQILVGEYERTQERWDGPSSYYYHVDTTATAGYVCDNCLESGSLQLTLPDYHLGWVILLGIGFILGYIACAWVF